LTVTALPDSSIKPDNYASHACSSAPDGPHAPKSYKTKDAAKQERTFFEKKVHAFCGVSARKNDDAKPEEQRAMIR
jgi:hypothetical protein